MLGRILRLATCLALSAAATLASPAPASGFSCAPIIYTNDLLAGNVPGGPLELLFFGTAIEVEIGERVV